MPSEVRLFPFWRARVPLSDALACDLEERFRYQTVPSGTVLIGQDAPCEQVFFVEKGVALARQNQESGTSRVINFFVPGEFMTDYTAYMQGLPSSVQIEAISELEVRKLSRQDYLRIAQEPPVLQFWQELLQSYIIRCSQIAQALRDQDSQARYAYLLDHYGAVVQTAKQQDLASFLGITPATLSRIRQKIKKQQ